jgi:cell division protease FtsH
LEKGDVEKVIVYNKSEAEVYLTPNTLKEPYHKAVAKDLLNRPTRKDRIMFLILGMTKFSK